MQITFSWTEQCQGMFEQLKLRLATSPVLCYPTVGKAFTLETDASKAGLGVVLFIDPGRQQRTPSCLCKSGIIPRKVTMLSWNWKLWLLWTISHFHAYLYGHNVLIYTDHSAVRAVLQIPSANGKYMR